jgi:hypothetical protein
MALKKRPGERWFTQAPDVIWQEYETPQEDSYVPKDPNFLAWSVQVVKGSQFKILFTTKIGTREAYTWTPIVGWEVASIQAMGDHVNVILENTANENVHMFMHQFTEPFDPDYAKNTCIEPETIKPETIFIDNNVANTKVASRFTKLKNAIKVANKALQAKPKPQPLRRKATTEEGAGSSRPLTLRKPRPVPADSRRTSTTATPADSETATPSGSRQTTPSKRGRESSVMTDEPISPELKMPKAGEEVDTVGLKRMEDSFEARCNHCFFMGRYYTFNVNIAQCHLAPPEKCVRAMEDAYVDWIITKMLAGGWKGDQQTIVVMPQGLKEMPTPDMWETISKGDFWLIDGQHSVEASKKMQLMGDKVPKYKKEKVKVWRALVVWSDEDTLLSDISRYFNSINKIKNYQASWIRNIMASREVWEVYGRPSKARENAKEKNPKWEVSIVWVDRPKLLQSFCSIVISLVWVDRPKVMKSFCSILISLVWVDRPKQ